MNACSVWIILLIGCIFSHTHAEKACVSNALRNATGDCECQEGFHGNGALCCLPKDHKICMVEGDPVIRAMNEDIIPVNIPCLYDMAEVHTIGSLYDETVNAFVAGEYGRNGILYMDYLKLEYRERYNDIHTVVEIYGHELIINGKSHNKSEPWSSEHWEIELHYDEASDTYMMMSMGTTIIHFVPPSQDTDEQKSIPGVCIGVARHSLLYDIGMCNQRRRGLQRSSANKGFHFLEAGVVEHIIRRMPMYQDIGPGQVMDTCKALNRARAPCADKWNPSMAACTIIVMDSDIRYCLSIAGLDILTTFLECTKAHCASDQDSCDFIRSPEVQQCITITPDCAALY